MNNLNIREKEIDKIPMKIYYMKQSRYSRRTSIIEFFEPCNSCLFNINEFVINLAMRGFEMDKFGCA